MTADTMVDLDALREAIDSDNHPIISLDVTMLSALIRELEAARAAVRRVHDDTPRIIRQVLRNELGYEDAYDAHSWRCHDKRRYPGPCPCADEIARILCHELALLGVSDDE